MAHTATRKTFRYPNGGQITLEARPEQVVVFSRLTPEGITAATDKVQRRADEVFEQNPTWTFDDRLRYWRTVKNELRSIEVNAWVAELCRDRAAAEALTAKCARTRRVARIAEGRVR